MIRPMRRWLLLVMVLLLPLRGLVGEAMAGQMMQHGGAAMAGHAMEVSAAPGAGDCDQHHAHPAAQADEAPAADGAPADCPTCASCQVCSSVALSPSVHTPAPVRAAQAPPTSVQFAWRSADALLAFKPPQA